MARREDPQLPLEDRVYRALSQRGWTIPVSEEEVERAETLLSQERESAGVSGIRDCSVFLTAVKYVSDSRIGRRPVSKKLKRISPERLGTAATSRRKSRPRWSTIG